MQNTVTMICLVITRVKFDTYLSEKKPFVNIVSGDDVDLPKDVKAKIEEKKNEEKPDAEKDIAAEKEAEEQKKAMEEEAAQKKAEEEQLLKEVDASLAGT